MARLNTSVPPSDATVDDSLYRLTPSANGTRATTRTPYSPSVHSDKENQEDHEEEAQGARSKGKGKQKGTMAPPPRNARRQPLGPNTGEHNIPASTRGLGEDMTPSQYEDLKYYDPDQNPAKRRKLRRDLRKNDREMHDNRDVLLQAHDKSLAEYIRRNDDYMREVKQTSDATIDSRFLVNASDIALKRATNLAMGDAGIGIDLDDFVSKCVTFMRNGGPLAADEELTNTQRRRQPRASALEADDDEDMEDSGDGLDWACFGELACFPTNKRPPVPGFLLGPLSVQKRVRATQRRAPKKKSQAVETRPEELKAQDLQQAENANLTSLCRNIRDRLCQHIENESSMLEQEIETSIEDLEPSILLRKYRLAQTKEEEPAVSLFDFAINPKSFGQTVENIFYISFLVRDGNARVDYDVEGLPILVPSQPRSLTEKRAQEVSKHQAIFSMDFKTWRRLIKAFDIQEPLIEHRREESQNVTTKGWYA